MKLETVLLEMNERIIERMGEIVARTAISLSRGIDQKTPVDTGRLRANWQCGIGSYSTGTTFSTTGTLTEKTSSAMSSWRLGDTVYLTNSLPYAHIVEFGLYGKPPGSANGPKTVAGYSRQAPGGMVRLTAQKFPDYVRRAVAETK